MDIINRTDTQLIENLATHLAVFPDWKLNDGDVRCRFTAGTTSPATLELDVLLSGEFRRRELMTVMPPEYCVTIEFSGLRNLILSDCVPPHVAGELVIAAVPAGLRRGAHRHVVYKPIAGLEFELECDRVSVVRVVPEDRATAV